MPNFDENTGEITTLATKVGAWIEADFKEVKLPADIDKGVKRLSEIRTTLLDTEKFQRMQPTELINLQAEVAGHKYYIARHLSLLMGAQSYAFIYRKYQAASQYNVVKNMLAAGQEKKPTVGEIDSQIEQNILAERKTEIAFQVVCDRLKVLIEWVDDAILILQNKIRDYDTNKKTRFVDDNSIKK